jgi:hypothetical protein
MKVEIDREILRQKMPRYAVESSCECDRKEWLYSEMLREFKKALDLFSQSDHIPIKVKVEFE